MKQRVQAGTDIAMIGAWDASRNDAALAKVFGKKQDAILEQDTTEGKLFLIRTGADGGGPIDVYIDSEAPEEVRKKMKPMKGEFLLSVPTGRLMVAGLEDYRTGKDVDETDCVEIPAGDYALRCFASEEEIGLEGPSRTQMEAAVGAADYNYYLRIQKITVTAYFGTIALFVILWLTMGWKKALLIATAVGVISFVALKVWTFKNARFMRVAKATNDLWCEAREREAPMFVFEMRRVKEVGKLKGGMVRL